MTSLPLYKIQKSKRRKKSTTIKVQRNGEVVVQVPHTMSKKDIQTLVRDKKVWIKKKLKGLKQRPKKTQKNFEHGELFSFLGEEYPLAIRKDESRKKGYLSFNQQQFTATIPPNWKKTKEKLRELFINWYKREGARIAKKEVETIAKELEVSYKEINLKNVKTLWGSCTPKKRLNFNWKITLTPFPVFRYVIVHEVCHLKIPGHSKKFWNLVESFDPDYKNNRKWLKRNSWKLSI